MKKLGLLFVVAISLVFTVSCVSKEVPVTETYYETEYKTESYTALEQTPHSTTLMQINEENIGEIYLFLFNMDNSGNINWAQATYRGFSGIKTFKPESSGQNHRVSITGTKDCGCGQVGCTLLVGRTSEAIAAGFRPIESTLVQPLETAQQKAFYHSWLEKEGPYIQYMEALNITGYDLSDQEGSGMLGDSNVEFSFDKMFKKDGWALIEISPWYETNPEKGLLCTPGCILTISISYIYDDIGRESTKYREVPVQVQKQRTVTQTKKVPFWEAIFH
jgi:hypothetical protein